ncbi:MAG: hypothetical protein IPN86_00035 [Saprospiraceae bacterium]|nr:hypothetical protein [Saprospiraceae bacterium]
MNLFQIPDDQIPNINAIITGFVNNHIRFHTIQLFRRSGSTAFVPEGTGVLVDYYGIFCLFTSKHILENSFESNQLYFKLGPEEYILCTGSSEESETKLEKNNQNLAYIILDLSIAESLTDLGYKFLPNDKILPYHDALETPQYAVVGFPKPSSDHNQENTQTNGSYIISPMAPNNYYDNHLYTKEENFIISYTQPQEIITGIKTKSKKLYNMSGSGLWYISITKNHETIENDYHLIGIITELYIHKRQQFLIASKINLLTDQLKAAIS